MISVLRTLYNNGDNDGNIAINTKLGQLKAHSFILENTSELFKACIKSQSFSNMIELDASDELVNIVMNYLYSEKIIDKELDPNDIINLYNLINHLRCKDSINISILKNHYLKKFPGLLNEGNWMDLLRSVYNISKYADFQEEIIAYYKSHILAFIEDLDINFVMSMYTNISDELKILLFSICLERVSVINAELRNNAIEAESKEKQKMNSALKSKSDDDDYDEYTENDKELIKPPIKQITSSPSPKQSTKKK